MKTRFTVERYSCVHPDCLSTAASSLSSEANGIFFPTWTALQAHNRIAHPPTCPYTSCNGRTFSATKNLRAHLKVHQEREVEDALACMNGDEVDADEEAERKKRRRGGEIGRDWICKEWACEKAFKSVRRLFTNYCCCLKKET
jgi:general transcription factor IIIA